LALKKQETCRQAPVAGCLAGPTPTRFHPSSTNLDNQTVDQQSHGKFTSCPQFDLARHGRLIYRARTHGCNCVWRQRTLPHCARCFTCFTEYLTRLPLLVVPRPSWGISGSGPRVLFWRCNAGFCALPTPHGTPWWAPRVDFVGQKRRAVAPLMLSSGMYTLSLRVGRKDIRPT
jgi:hypothetical protein